MFKTVTAFVLFVALSACAHTDLKAPCTNIVALSAGSVPCNEREPIYTVDVPSLFAE